MKKIVDFQSQDFLDSNVINKMSLQSARLAHFYLYAIKAVIKFLARYIQQNYIKSIFIFRRRLWCFQL